MIEYEWAIEEIDEAGDICDVNHVLKVPGENESLVLVRDDWRSHNLRRSWN